MSPAIKLHLHRPLSIIRAFFSYRNGKTHVDVQPAVVLLTDVGDRVDGVEGSKHGGSGRGVHEEGDVSFGLALQDEPLQLGRDHAAPEHRDKVNIKCGRGYIWWASREVRGHVWSTKHRIKDSPVVRGDLHAVIRAQAAHRRAALDGVVALNTQW